MRTIFERVQYICSTRERVIEEQAERNAPTDPVTVSAILQCLFLEELTEAIEKLNLSNRE